MGYPYQPLVEAWQELAPGADGHNRSCTCNYPPRSLPYATSNTPKATRHTCRSTGMLWEPCRVGDPDDQAWLPSLAAEPSGLIPKPPVGAVAKVVRIKLTAVITHY